MCTVLLASLVRYKVYFTEEDMHTKNLMDMIISEI
jgi:hypothetical protein